MHTQNNCQSCAPLPCQPCAPVPTEPAAPPPFCPATPACDEFIPSDCVVSTVDVSCTATYIPPNGGTPVPVGLDINLNTTLTSVYNQLTSTACIFNPNVLGAVLQLIGSNTTLSGIFCDLVNSCPEEGCANVVPVEIATYTNIEVDGFDINFLAQPGYRYEITINDSNATPFTKYTYNTPTAPNLTTAPVPYTINTSAFTKNVGGTITNPPTAMTPGHSYEVYISAVNTQNTSCPAGPWTVVLPEDPTCGEACSFVQIAVTGDPTNTTNLVVVVDYLGGVTYPVQYQIDVYDTGGLVSSANYNTTSNTSSGGIYPPITQNINYPSITTSGTYTVEVTPICSLVPLCEGEMVTAEIAFDSAAFCAPPDITNITVTSI